MSNGEREQASRIVRCLDRGLAEMDHRTLAALRSARETALERMEPAPAWRPAWAGIGRVASGLRYLTPRFVMPVAALLLAVSGMVYWQQLQHFEDPVDIDAQLLSGDLPIDAYLDKGLDAWLKR